MLSADESGARDRIANAIGQVSGIALGRSKLSPVIQVHVLIPGLQRVLRLARYGVIETGTPP
jgi:hypothetical protein